MDPRSDDDSDDDSDRSFDSLDLEGDGPYAQFCEFERQVAGDERLLTFCDNWTAALRQNPSSPFVHLVPCLPFSLAKTDQTSIEERRLFEEWESEYSPDVDAFTKRWNDDATRRWREWSFYGQKDIILINSKTSGYIRQYFDVRRIMGMHIAASNAPPLAPLLMVAKQAPFASVPTVLPMVPKGGVEAGLVLQPIPMVNNVQPPIFHPRVNIKPSFYHKGRVDRRKFCDQCLLLKRQHIVKDDTGKKVLKMHGQCTTLMCGVCRRSKWHVHNHGRGYGLQCDQYRGEDYI